MAVTAGTDVLKSGWSRVRLLHPKLLPIGIKVENPKPTQAQELCINIHPGKHHFVQSSSFKLFFHFWVSGRFHCMRTKSSLVISCRHSAASLDDSIMSLPNSGSHPSLRYRQISISSHQKPFFYPSGMQNSPIPFVGDRPDNLFSGEWVLQLILPEAARSWEKGSRWVYWMVFVGACTLRAIVAFA